MRARVSARKCARESVRHAHSSGSALSARKQNGPDVYGTGGRCDSISWMTNRARNVVRRRLKGAAPARFNGTRDFD